MIHWSLFFLYENYLIVINKVFFFFLGWAARTTGLNQLEATQEALRTNFVGK